MEQNCGLKELRGHGCGQSQAGRALAGEVESRVGFQLAVMMAEEGVGITNHLNCVTCLDMHGVIVNRMEHRPSPRALV